MSREEVATWVVESRRKQGLPEHVTDPATLAELAADVLTAAQGGDGHGEAA